jgi:hypothetical protein
MRTAEAKPRTTASLDEVALTNEGDAKLAAELQRLVSAGRSDVVSLGSHVVLEDLDDSSREDYVLVSSAESNPAEGRLSSESPVGRAISGHRRGDVVDAHVPRRVRHLRIVDLQGGQRRR